MDEIAMFFHWPLSEMDAMTLEEVISWRNRAVRLHNKLNSSEGET